MFLRLFLTAQRTLYRKKVNRIVSTARRQVRALKKKVVSPKKIVRASPIRAAKKQIKKKATPKKAVVAPKKKKMPVVRTPKAPPKRQDPIVDAPAKKEKIARAPSVYAIFVRENYAAVSAACVVAPGALPKERLGAIGSQMAAKWKALSDDERKVYRDKAATEALSPKAPKKQSTARVNPYALFLKAQYKEVAAGITATNNKDRVQQIAKEVSARWAALTPEQRANYGKGTPTTATAPESHAAKTPATPEANTTVSAAPITPPPAPVAVPITPPPAPVAVPITPQATATTTSAEPQAPAATISAAPSLF